MQSDNIEQAAGLTRDALVVTRRQPIMPVLHEGRRIRRLIQQRNPAACGDLAEELNGFAHALTVVAARVER